MLDCQPIVPISVPIYPTVTLLCNWSEFTAHGWLFVLCYFPTSSPLVQMPFHTFWSAELRISTECSKEVKTDLRHISRSVVDSRLYGYMDCCALAQIYRWLNTQCHHLSLCRDLRLLFWNLKPFCSLRACHILTILASRGAKPAISRPA